MKDLEVSEAFTGKFSLDLNLLPASEGIGGSPISKEPAVGVRDGRQELGGGLSVRLSVSVGVSLSLDHLQFLRIGARSRSCRAGRREQVVDGLRVEIG